MDLTQLYWQLITGISGQPIRPIFKGQERWISLPLNVAPIACPVTSIRSYYSTLRNIPEECRSQPTLLMLTSVCAMSIVMRHLRFSQRWYSWGLRSSGIWHCDLLLDCLTLKACRNVTRSVTSHAVSCSPCTLTVPCRKLQHPWSPRQGE